MVGTYYFWVENQFDHQFFFQNISFENIQIVIWNMYFLTSSFRFSHSLWIWHTIGKVFFISFIYDIVGHFLLRTCLGIKHKLCTMNRDKNKEKKYVQISKRKKIKTSSSKILKLKEFYSTFITNQKKYLFIHQTESAIQNKM